MKKALVVGINGYGFPNDLGSSTRDAEMFGNLLEAVYRFDQVRVLKDGDATKDAVDRALEWLCQSAAANDRLVFFFSGHGCRYERHGVLEEGLVLQDGRVLDGHQLADRADSVPAGVLTIVVDAGFSGLDEMLIHPSGQVEVARIKRWLPTDGDRGRHDRSPSPGVKAFMPFGHRKPVAPSGLAGRTRGGAPLDPSPARLTTEADPQARAMMVLPCLADEVTTASTSQTNGLSPFTACLIGAIRRLGHNRSAFELLQATGHELRQLGFRQTPVLVEPAQPEHLGLRTFLTFQPVLFVHPSSTPGSESEGELTRSIAEAVRSTLINIKEGPMQATFPGAQTFLGEGFSPHGMGAQGWWGGGFGQRGLHEEIAQIVGAVVPAVLAGLQSRAYQPYLPGFQPQAFHGAQGFQGPMGPPPLQPYEIAHIVSTVTPIVTSLIQNRGYQGHFGQFMPRAA